MLLEFTDKGKKYHFTEKVRALALADFQKYFTSCGLNIVHLWGDYELGAFDAELSDRLIIVAKK